jgi:hypothetical protein
MRNLFTILWLVSSIWAYDTIPESKFAFEAGESLEYDITYGFTVGKAVLALAKNGKDSLILKGYARNNGFFKAVYPVRDTLETRVSKNGMWPSSFKKILNEGGWHSRTYIDIKKSMAHLSDSVFTDVGNKGKLKRFKDTSVTLVGQHHTIMSAFYFFRTLDLTPGKEYVFKAVSGKKVYPLKVLVHRKEMIEVPAGKFDCVVIEPITGDDGIFKAKGKLTIWITDDDRRLPVLVETKIAVGSIGVELTKWKQ